MEKKPALIDVPVLLIFFIRPNTFREVFAGVKEARPSKLFLACDGPRENHPDDAEKIAECRKIASEIDWECEVYTNYAEKNLGCGIRPQSAISWALESVDRVIILEDDCVPELSFFGYAAELLERYKDDTRVGMISGLNHFKDWDCGGYSYCFAKNAAIWGWATWRRVWKDYDYTVDKVNDAYVQKILPPNMPGTNASRRRKLKWWQEASARLRAGENLSYWDLQFDFLKFAYSYLQIVPKHNLIHNIGMGEGASHFSKAKVHGEKHQWKKGELEFMPTKPMELPLSHPPIMVYDYDYTNAVDRLLLSPGFFRKNLNRAKRVFRRIF